MEQLGLEPVPIWDTCTAGAPAPQNVFFSMKLYMHGPAPWWSRLILCLQRRHPIWAPVLVPAAPLPIQLSAVAWESSGRWPKSLGPCTRVGDLEEAPGSWLWIGAAPAIAAIWEVNQRTEDLSFCLSLSLSVTLPLKLIKKTLIKKITF